MSFYIYETTVEKKGDVEVNVLDAEQIRARNAVAIAFVKSYRYSGPIPHPTLKEQLDIVIEQAERAQELEKEIERYKEFSGRLQLRNDNLTEALQDRDEENKRLREALEFYADTRGYYRSSQTILTDKGEIARQALEGVSNDQTIQT